MCSFDGFWEELRDANHSVTKNFVLDNCLTYGLINDSYVYHSVTVSSAAELEKLIADENVYDLIPVKAEIKAMISGIYITSVKNVRGKKAPEPAKKSFSQKLRAKQKKYEQTYEQETASMKLSKEEKAARKAKAKEEKERAKKIQ